MRFASWTCWMPSTGLCRTWKGLDMRTSYQTARPRMRRLATSRLSGKLRVHCQRHSRTSIRIFRGVKTLPCATSSSTGTLGYCRMWSGMSSRTSCRSSAPSLLSSSRIPDPAWQSHRSSKPRPGRPPIREGPCVVGVVSRLRAGAPGCCPVCVCLHTYVGLNSEGQRRSSSLSPLGGR